MSDVLDDFKADLDEDNILVIMPISRLVVSESFRIGKYHFYPSGDFDTNQLRIVSNLKHISFNIKPDDYVFLSLSGQSLREAQSNATGFEQTVFEHNSSVGFHVEMNWDEFLDGDHQYDLNLLSKLSQEAEAIMNLIRFELCKIILPDTLPGSTGTWSNTDGGTNGFSGALLYNAVDHESYLIAGSIHTQVLLQKIIVKV